MAPLQRGETRTTPARPSCGYWFVPRIERAPPAHVAYGWPPAQPAVTSITVGASNREQLTQSSAPPTSSWTRMALDSIDPPEPVLPGLAHRLETGPDSR